jgi:hypothetical protein
MEVFAVDVRADLDAAQIKLGHAAAHFRASSAFCSGTVPMPTNRSGWLATAAAIPSFTARAASRPVSASA